MARSMVSGRVVRTRGEAGESCLALSGKGLPGGAALEEAIEAVAAAAKALRALGRTRRHEFRPPDPEVYVRTPEGRGGTHWTVLVRVPGWVTAAEARTAAATAAARRPIAKSIRLSPADPAAAAPVGPPGRDRLPGQLRRTRAGSPQHRAREQRRR